MSTSADGRPSVSSLVREAFPGRSFLQADMKMAGKLLKSDGPEAVLAYLSDPVRRSFPSGGLPDFRPPAKCVIVGVSRPVEEWPIHRFSMAFQEAVYGMTESAFSALVGMVPKSLDATSRLAIIEAVMGPGGVPGKDVLSKSQGLNKIVLNAISVYKGAVKKVENRNEKRRKSAERRSKRGGSPPAEFVPESPFGEDGRLIDAPRPNRCLFGYQGMRFRALRPGELSSLPGIEERLLSISVRDPSLPLVSPAAPDRASIPAGQPGWVPDWQRGPKSDRNPFPFNPEKRGRRKMWYSRSLRKPKPNRRTVESPASGEARLLGSVLGVLNVGGDWALVDLRGLLRNALWRARARVRPLELPRLSADSLLSDLFSADVVIDPVSNVATVLYKEGVVPVVSRKVIGSSRAPDRIRSLLGSSPVATVSCDLGQTNPVAARVSRIASADGSLVSAESWKFFLPEDILSDMRRIRVAWDALETEIRLSALASLPPGMRDEVERADHTGPLAARERLCRLLGIEDGSVVWASMGSRTTHIADALAARGLGWSHVRFRRPLKDGEVPWDSSFSRAEGVRPCASRETMAALESAKHLIKRGHGKYAALAKARREVSRRAANYVLQTARSYSGCDEVVVCIEDLDVGGSFFHGRGKPAPGWDGFFSPRLENRWFIVPLHGALSDLASHRGVTVVECPHRYTSQTCPLCGYRDKKNRSGERFFCLSCRTEMHADLDAATINIERIALTGVGIRRGEMSDSPPGPGVSRVTDEPPPGMELSPCSPDEPGTVGLR